MTDRNIRLMAAYEEIVASLRTISGRPDSSTERDVINQASKVHGPVRTNQRFLRQIKDVRNLLAHPTPGNPSQPFEVTERFLSEAEQLSAILKKVPRAQNLGVPLKNLYTAEKTTVLKDIVSTMRDKNFSHVPIIFDDCLVGVFSENTIFEYFCGEEIIALEEGMTISNLFAYCEVSSRRLERYVFTRPSLLISEVAQLFSKGLGKAERVGAVFVTRDGRVSSPVQRMITAWDVLDADSST